MKLLLAASLAGLLATAGLAGQRGRRPREGGLKVGDPAPDFELPLLGSEGKVKLSAFKGDRPVVLIFGSYT